MTETAGHRLRIGDWRVDPSAGELVRGDDVVRVEARTLRLLLELAARPGETVSIDALLDQAWAGVIVTPDSVYQAVASLRRALGDDPKRPRYIATVPRLGYRLVAEVGAWDDPAPARASPPHRFAPWIAAGAAALLLTGGLVAFRPAPPRPPARPSVGVAPFVDLTPSMDQDKLADEMTEAVADRLSHDPALRTPGFRASYFLIGKHASVAQAAKTLGVAFVVDGSVRRDGDNVRVAARLVRAETGLIVWAQTWERPIRDMPSLAAAVSGGVTRALYPASRE